MALFKSGTVVIGLLACANALGNDSPPSQAAPPRSPAQEVPAKGRHMDAVAEIKRGHEALWNEGWSYVSSSRDAINYARDHAITSSGQALSQAFKDAGRNTAAYGDGLKSAAKAGVQTGTDVYRAGSGLTDAEWDATGKLARKELDVAGATLGLAGATLLRGYITLSERTHEDWEALRAVPWYKNFTADEFRNLNRHLTDAFDHDVSPHIEAGWGRAYDEAVAEFDAAYEQSGTRDNPISGSLDMLAGWGRVLYSGLAKPAARSARRGAQATGEGALVLAEGATKAVFLPTAAVFIAAGDTIESTGLSLYYLTSMGVKVASPTVESGFLAALSLASYASVPVTAGAGYAAGAVNQIVVDVAAPTAGAARAVAAGAAHTGAYAVQVTYDLGKGTTRVAMNMVQSGVVLGYNVLTALPAQLFQAGVIDVVFLGLTASGRLELVGASGNVEVPGKDGAKVSVPLRSLPVGGVVDLDALKKEPGVKLQVLSDDPQVTRKALEKLPDDLREKGKP